MDHRSFGLCDARNATCVRSEVSAEEAMAATPVEPALDVSDAHVSYNGTHVLRGVSLRVHAKETLAILGRSGCGKTTLLRGICGLVPLRGGQVSLNGQNIIEGPTC